MISKEDYNFIVAFDTSDSNVKEAKLKENPGQAAKTFPQFSWTSFQRSNHSVYSYYD